MNRNISAVLAASTLIFGALLPREEAVAQTAKDREAAGDVAKPQTSSPTDFVDTLNAIFGKQTTNRATHAKGIVVQGKFTPSDSAQSLSKAPHFHQPVPITCRFSDDTGIPTLPDADGRATPYGMALNSREKHGSKQIGEATYTDDHFLVLGDSPDREHGCLAGQRRRVARSSAVVGAHSK